MASSSFKADRLLNPDEVAEFLRYPELKPLSTVPEIAEFLSCSERTVRGLISSGEIECVRVGRLVRVTRDAVLAFLANGGTSHGETPSEDRP